MPLSPCESFKAWESIAEDEDFSEAKRKFAAWAMKQLSRPMSAACVERVFSYLSHMDASDRRTMKKETLKRLLFLRANHATLSELVEEESARRVMASKAGADERSRKRAREGKKAMDAVTEVAKEAAAKREVRAGRGSMSCVCVCLCLCVCVSVCLC